MCIYIYIEREIHIYVGIYIYIHTYVHMYVCVYIYIYMFHVISVCCPCVTKKSTGEPEIITSCITQTTNPVM